MDVNDLVYYSIVGLQVIIGLFMLISASLWGISNQTKNINLKKNSGIVFIISTGIFYLVRFGSITLLAILDQSKQAVPSTNFFVDLLRLIQVIAVSITPTFFLLESYIFKYQFLFTEHIDSKQQEKKFLLFATVLPAIIVIALQLMINLVRK